MSGREEKAIARSVEAWKSATCKVCPLSDAFDGIEGCCEIDPTTPRCESCGVPLVKHLGLTGTCAELIRCQDALESATQDAGLYLSLLRRVIRMSCLTVERCTAGYPDVAEFLREEEISRLDQELLSHAESLPNLTAQTKTAPSEEGKENDDE